MKSNKFIIGTMAAACLLTGCIREPELLLHKGANVDVQLPVVNVDFKVFWSYDVDVDWDAEWTYGWDETDDNVYGRMGYREPTTFELRRYYLGEDSTETKHTTVDEFYVTGYHLSEKFKYGYHDMLAWNEIPPLDHQSLIIDEANLDTVMAYTNLGMRSAGRTTRSRAFYQPEDLFAGYEPKMYVSRNFDDYDFYDPETNTYFISAKMHLSPVTYIYLTQIRLHNNSRGLVWGTSGEASLCGMSSGVVLNTGISFNDSIPVGYSMRMKKGLTIKQTGEEVDVIGGRCMTFGIPNQNSSAVAKEEVNTRSKHYLEVDMLFHNGTDSLMTFDITDQVHKYYKGGVITIDLDVDKIVIPSRKSGSGLDAKVEDFEDHTVIITL